MFSDLIRNEIEIEPNLDAYSFFRFVKHPSEKYRKTQQVWCNRIRVIRRFVRCCFCQVIWFGVTGSYNEVPAVQFRLIQAIIIAVYNSHNNNLWQTEIAPYQIVWIVPSKSAAQTKHHVLFAIEVALLSDRIFSNASASSDDRLHRCAWP